MRTRRVLSWVAWLASATFFVLWVSAPQVQEWWDGIQLPPRIKLDEVQLRSRATAMVPPVVPAAYRGNTGVAVVGIRTDAKGVVRRVNVLQGPPELQHAIVSAVRQWRFSLKPNELKEPYGLAGKLTFYITATEQSTRILNPADMPTHFNSKGFEGTIVRREPRE